MNQEDKNIYFDKVQKELKSLRKKLKSISAWKTEIEVITQKLNAYKSGGFPFVSTSNATITIDDILARDETRINILESNIEYTNFKLNEYKPYLELLDDNEYEVINRKYLTIENKRVSYEKIGEDMHYSNTTVKKWHDSAITKIASYKYEDTDWMLDVINSL